LCIATVGVEKIEETPLACFNGIPNRAGHAVGKNGREEEDNVGLVEMHIERWRKISGGFIDRCEEDSLFLRLCS
jgi:hypothetical protein